MSGLRRTDHAIAEALLSLGFVAFGVGGSRAAGTADAASDTDLYAFHRGVLPAAYDRVRVLQPLADGGRVFVEDAWGVEDHIRVDGHLVEVIYLDLDALGIEAFYDPGVWPTGYTTAFLHTLAGCLVVDDPAGELRGIQDRLATYPEATRDRLLKRLPDELSGYLEQLAKAARRRDWTSVTHRRTAVQVAWFDLLFAIDRRYHPGEKRLLGSLARCQLLPDDAVARWERASLLPADDPSLTDLMASLAADLVALGRRHSA